MNIEINSQQTRSKASEILNSVEQLNDKIKLLYSVIEKLETAWESDLATEYITMMKEKNLPELQELSDVLNKYGKFMYNIPSAYDTLDEIFASKEIGVK